jgi:hypothetical protein
VSAEAIMNADDQKISNRTLVLELWWLKARRSASGQNYAALRAAKFDAILTVANIALPLLVFGISACGSLAHRFSLDSAIPLSDYLILATACLLASSAFQFAGDYKTKSVEHRNASNEFDALAQRIEATLFNVPDDVMFQDISNQLERIRQMSRHVPAASWADAKSKFNPKIDAARARILPRPADPDV